MQILSRQPRTTGRSIGAASTAVGKQPSVEGLAPERDHEGEEAFAGALLRPSRNQIYIHASTWQPARGYTK